MRKLLLLAGAAALLGAGPALAKPGNQGHGKGHVAKVKVVKTAKVRTARVKPAKVKIAKVKAAKAKKVWLNACPPGLAWRLTACVPPGHANRVLAIGTRVPGGWSYTPWGRVPMDLRTTYGLDPGYRYIYRDGVIYAVDPRTRLITSIISAVL